MSIAATNKEQLETITANQVALTKSARASVLIVSGGLRSEMYDNADLFRATQEALARGVAFTVVVGPNYLAEGSKRTIDALLENPKIACLYSLVQRPPIHFSIADGLHVRYEGPHPVEDEPTNELRFNAPEAARALFELLDEMMRAGQPRKVEKG